MADYKLNPAAFQEHLLNATFMEAEMRYRGEKVLNFAVATSPVYHEGPHPGRYRDSFELESGKHGGVKHDRAYVIVRNVSPEAVFVEFGTEHNRAHHTLGSALDVLGLLD